ncbi:MAG: Gfo/Idh/MocA family oxidoreductase, partial [Acidobacteria bacterium]|nr:Gfo/Idh/MocA family oxidoreductase [Acidobacteriota bacterium]
MSYVSRRDFFCSSMASALTARAAVAPSDRVRVGLVGCGGISVADTNAFLAHPEVEFAVVCDVDDARIAKTVARLEKAGGKRPEAVKDFRRVVERKDIDVCLICTPDHWHALPTIAACQAGKDVYVEKPLTHKIDEGFRVIEAVRRTHRVVQVGMQRRSFDLYLEGRKIVAAGTLGNVRMVRSWWLNNYLGGQNAKLDGPLDWDQWQGPAKHRVPPDAHRFRNWRFYSDYAGGILADQGAHVFDGIHLLMNASYPLAVNASANKPHKPLVDKPESVVAVAEYPEDFVAVFSINYAAMKYTRRNDQLNQLDGDRARMDIGREECKVYLEGAE